MNKNEIIEAINATIVTNGQKGITAESLANILLEMVNATPEGSGAGVPYVHIGSVNIETGEISQTAEQKAHNAEVFQLVKNSDVPPAIAVDFSGLYEADFGVSVKASNLACIVEYVQAGMLPEVTEDMINMITIDGDCISLIADGTITLESTGE